MWLLTYFFCKTEIKKRKSKSNYILKYCKNNKLVVDKL